jgi:hypothetical protein
MIGILGMIIGTTLQKHGQEQVLRSLTVSMISGSTLMRDMVTRQSGKAN